MIMPVVRRPANALATILMMLAARGMDADEVPTFEVDIRPIFAAHCVRCHGEETQKAELNLGTAAGLRRGGESGESLLASELDQNLLYELVASGEMPPEDDKRLAATEVSVIERWLDSGAKFASDPTYPEVTLNQHDVLPILFRRCTVCHGAVYQEGSLDLRSRGAMIRGGSSGPAVVPGKPDESRMVARVVQRQCPPEADIGEAGIEPMTPEELAVVKAWILADAPERPIAPDVASTAGDPLVRDEDRQFCRFSRRESRNCRRL